MEYNKVYKVVYMANNGSGIVYDKTKAVFNHRRNGDCLGLGIAEVDLNSYEERKKYILADMKNVTSVEPRGYREIDHYLHIGVPKKIYTGMYGGCVFFKEEYGTHTFIKAYDIDGKMLIKEKKLNWREDTCLNNSIYYRELAEVIGEWEDITDNVHASIKKSILGKNSSIEVDDILLMQALKAMEKGDKVYRTDNNIIMLNGKYDTFIVWSENDEICSCWVDNSLELVGKDISDEVVKVRRDNYLISCAKRTQELGLYSKAITDERILNSIDTNIVRVYMVNENISQSGIILLINILNMSKVANIHELVDSVKKYNNSNILGKARDGSWGDNFY